MYTKFCSLVMSLWQRIVGAGWEPPSGQQRGEENTRAARVLRKGPGLRAGEVSKFLVLYPAATLLILVPQQEKACFSF